MKSAVIITWCAMCLACGAAPSSSPAPFAFGVMGDAPYVPGDVPRVAAVIRDMNRADLVFVVHVGDIQAAPPDPVPGGVPTCTDASLKSRLELFGESRHSFIVTPGDNDWTDCLQAEGQPADPLERLAAFRHLFYPDAQSLGQRRMTLAVQGDDSRHGGFVENRLWTHGGVVFATLHMVGSNNNAGRTAEMDAEAAARDAAGRDWLAHAFERAAAEEAKGVVIFTQANPQFETLWPASQVRRYLSGMPPSIPETRRPTGFDGFLADLKRHVAGFRGPVLLVHGDTHLFRVDKPLVSDTDGRVVENFTRLETFGAPDVHWVMVRVDPGRAGFFAFSPQLVAEPHS